MSKIIHAEAITFMYSHSTFINVSVEDNDPIYGFLEDLRDLQRGLVGIGRHNGQQLSAI